MKYTWHGRLAAVYLVGIYFWLTMYTALNAPRNSSTNDDNDDDDDDD